MATPSLLGTITEQPGVTLGAGVNCSFSHTVPSGGNARTKLYIVFVQFNYSNTTGVASAPTWNGTTSSLVSSRICNSGGTNDLLAVYVIDNPTPGTGNVVIDPSESGASNDWHAFAFCLQDVNDTTPHGTAVTNESSGGNSVSLSNVGAAVGDLMLSFGFSYDGSDFPSNTLSITNTTDTVGDGNETSDFTDCIVRSMVADGTTETFTVENRVGGTLNATTWIGGLAFAVKQSSSATVNQSRFRWGLDDGTESAHTWAAAENANITDTANLTRLIRLQLKTVGDEPALAYKLQFRKNAGAYADVPVGSSTSSLATISYVNGTSGGGTGASYNVSLTGLGIQEGDLVVVATGFTTANVNGNPGVTSPADFTEIQDLFQTDTRAANLAVAYKVMGATPDTSITVTGPNDAAYGGCTVVHVWRNVDATTPMDVTSVAAQAANAARPNPGPITPTTAGAVIVAAGLGTGATSQTTFTIPSGMANGVTYKHDGTTGDCSAFLCSIGWTSGQYDPAAATGGTTSTSDAWCAVTMALRPKTVVTNNEVYISTSANIAAGGEATTARLTSPGGTFTTGRRWDDENGTDTIDIVADGYTEVEWPITIASSAQTNDYFDFRVASVDTYTATPRWTIGSGTAKTGTGAPASDAFTASGTGARGAAGTGAPASAVATVAGTGAAGWQGTGALASEPATASGTGARGIKESDGENPVAAGSATVAGTGSIASPAAVTGTGALSADVTAVAGVGTRDSVGAGDNGKLSAENAVVAGAGERGVAGTGAPAADAAAVAGTGSIESPAAITGTGALAADVTAVAGAGERGATGTGALASTDATTAGDGVAGAFNAGTGALSAAAATIAGVGTRDAYEGGTVDLVSGDASVAGAGTVESVGAVTGTGALAADVAVVAGTGARGATATGAPAADVAVVAGTGVVGSAANIVGTGALAAGVVAVAGAGARGAAGTGAPAAGVVTVSGAATRAAVAAAITLLAAACTTAGTGNIGWRGTGALSALPAQVIGSNVVGTSGSGALSTDLSAIAGVGARGSEDGGGDVELLTSLAAASATGTRGVEDGGGDVELFTASAAVAGAGLVGNETSRFGSGSLLSALAGVGGIGTRDSFDTGATVSLSASTASLAGVGAIGPYGVSAAPAAGPATVSGAGTHTPGFGNLGTGFLSVGTVSLVGLGTHGIYGYSAFATGVATVAGSGVVSTPTAYSGVGALFVSPASVAGQAARDTYQPPASVTSGYEACPRYEINPLINGRVIDGMCGKWRILPTATDGALVPRPVILRRAKKTTGETSVIPPEDTQAETEGAPDAD